MTHEALRRFLICPLWAYIEANWRPEALTSDVRAAYALEAKAMELAARFEAREFDESFDESMAHEIAQSLRVRWLEFIAHAAGPYLYHVIPKQHAQRVSAPKGKRRGWPLYLSAEHVAPTIATLPAGHTYEDIIAALCDRARRSVPANRRAPPGDPDATAKRAYLDAIASGQTTPLRSKRRSERDQP